MPVTMQVRGKVKLLEGMRFTASANSGPDVIMGSSDDMDEVRAPSPMELVMLAAGCCTAMDVVQILRKMRQPPSDVEVDLVAERSEEDPRVFKTISFTYRLSGEGLEEASVRRAVKLSQETYCSVGVMLRRAGVEMPTYIEIEDMQE